MKYLYGRNVFLTGGSSGIGLAAAELLAANGYIVYAASRNPHTTPRSFPGGGVIRPVKLDVCNAQSVSAVACDVLSEADIGIVVHCAGIGIACPGEIFADEAVTGLMNTNFTGVLRVNNAFLPHLRQRGVGICVIIGSLAGLMPIPFQSHYCASKAALDLYSSTLRLELREYGVRVCLVMPGDTKTGFTDARTYEIDESSAYYNACLRAVRKMENDERNGRQPETVAHVILNLFDRENPPASVIVGFSYKLLALLQRLLPERLVLFILRKIYM